MIFGALQAFGGFCLIIKCLDSARKDFCDFRDAIQKKFF